MIKLITLSILTLLTSLSFAQGNEFAKNGLFVDALIGGTALSSHITNGADEIGLFAFNARIGSKWYLGENKKFRAGAQLTYARMGFSVVRNFGTTYAFFNFIPVNPGFTGYLAFNDKMGLETNLNVGPGFTFNKRSILVGVHVNPEVKFRYKALALGFDFSLLNALI